MRKLNKLKNNLRKMSSCLLAFSGGVDSAFLLKVARDVLKDKLLAVTAVSATYPEDELIFSKKLAKKIGVKHQIIRTNELKNKNFILNPLNRCYFCKKELFLNLKNIAAKNKINFVIDASNLSDKRDFRPGNKAKKELKIRSPLQEAGLTKQEIRDLSKKMGLDTWDKPSMACLASRIPYGTRITPSILKKIEKAEKFLFTLGFKQARVRHYQGLCRVEVFKEQIPKLLSKKKLVIDKFKSLGYNYVTVDLEGYRTGSLNPVKE